MDLALQQVIVENRFRQDLGDLSALMASIADLGLLHPILVTPEYRLIDGARRLEAHARLGRVYIEARIVHVPSLLRAEHDANELAKAFTVSERVAIATAIEEEIGNRQGQRTDKLPQKFAEVVGQETRALAAERAGFGNKETYRQAKKVVEEGSPALVDAMNTGLASISTAANLVTLPTTVQEELVARGEKEILATAQRIRAERAHRTKYTGENEWYTPEEYLAKVREVFGSIDLDAASSDLAQETVQATRYFSLEDDALVQEWRGNVWLNPPYSQPAIAHFIDKLLAEWTAGHITQALLLTHNSTDTAWFHKAMVGASALCFTRGRIAFVSALRDIAAPPQGQTFFYFGPDIARFATVFTVVGHVLVDYACDDCCQARKV
jgi:ParB family transcriptional regulator, chromosome partitioning protein